MARNTDTVFTDLDIFAKNGDKAVPPFAMNTGWSSVYDASSPNPSFPSRETYNQLFYRLYALAELTTKFGGSLLWGETIAYEKGAIVVSPLGNPFYAVQTSTGVDPDTDVSMTYWVTLVPTANTEFMDSSGIMIATGNSNLISGVANVKNQVTYSSSPSIDSGKQTTYPTTNDMINGNSFFDHNIVGQSNNWEFDFTYDNPNNDALIIVTLEQDDTNKKYSSMLQVLKETNTNAKFTATFTTVSTADSIDMTKGYKLYTRVLQNNLNSVQLNKVTRLTNATK